MIEKVSKLLPEQYLSEIDFDPVLDGFTRLCRDALTALVNVVFNDLDEPIFSKLFTRDWYFLYFFFM